MFVVGNQLELGLIHICAPSPALQWLALAPHLKLFAPGKWCRVLYWEERALWVPQDLMGDAPVPSQVAGESHPPLHTEDGTQVSGTAAAAIASTSPPRARCHL